METKLQKLLIGPPEYDCAVAFQDEEGKWFLIGGRGNGDGWPGAGLKMVGPLDSLGPYRENPDAPGELQHKNFW